MKKDANKDFFYETSSLSKPGVHQLHFTFQSKVAGSERQADFIEEILVGVKGGLSKIEYQLSTTADAPSKYAKYSRFLTL